MCGIAGFWSFEQKYTAEELKTLGHSMSQALERRGPDGLGLWVDDASQIVLAHRRLAIQDVSHAGDQPMHSANGRFVIIYNGEIFNGQDLRADLIPRGIVFRGHSDTEAILEGCAAWGVRQTVERLIGMFAFVLWDKQEKSLYLVRDRLGIKPLYWGKNGHKLVFGSVVTALVGQGLGKPSLNHEALKSYLLYSYIPCPLSVYEGIKKLQPGTMVTIKQGELPRQEAYWTLNQIIHQGLQDPFCGTEAETITALDDLLQDVVEKRMVSDVPLGAFLSGGVDSSLVVALMQQRSQAPVKTFSIGFKEPAYDEAPYAKAVAGHLGTDHHELYFSMAEAANLVPQITDWYDEPFADSSQLPTYLVSKVARQHVTVSLSGDGGDELFAGYSRYHLGHAFWQRLKTLPQSVRKGSAYLFEHMPGGVWNAANQMIPFAPKNLALKAQKLARVLRSEHLEDFYQNLIWSEPQAFNYLQTMDQPPQNFKPHEGLQHPVSQMQYWDTLTYLPDDILTKVDRASMAVSLEARVPLLDHRLVAFAWRLPHDFKVRDNQGKWILRQVLDRYVPRSLIERPKMGFGIPIDAWLKKDLKPWADELLSLKALEDNPILDPHKTYGLWQDYCDGKHAQGYFLWTLLMLQSWLRRG